jgi:hypothetical protein
MSYEFTETSIPSDFENDQSNGVLTLPFFPNYLYNGPREGNKVELLAAFADPANYAGSSTPYNINTSGTMSWATSFTVSLVLAIAATVVAAM